MKNTLQLLLIYPFIFLLAYLIGSFSNASFDMTNWDKEILSRISLFLGLFILIYTGIVVSHYVVENEK